MTGFIMVVNICAESVNPELKLKGFEPRRRVDCLEHTVRTVLEVNHMSQGDGNKMRLLFVVFSHTPVSPPHRTYGNISTWGLETEK